MQLNEEYWNNRYLEQNTGWDIGYASPPLVEYFKKIKDKSLAILIPGCGSGYEAEYLVNNGFKNVTVIDISKHLTIQLKNKLGNKCNVIHGDFFKHNGSYDLIIEQTFFCALNPELRKQYVVHMLTLLKPKGILVGLLFNTTFEKDGPPFGATKKEYEQLFANYFTIIKLKSSENSIPQRLGNELFFIFEKK